VEARDPTGCGDVFGGALVAQLIGGDTVEDAVHAANAAAARNVQYRGATNLHYHLRGEIVPQ
jgi:fructokinase